MAVKQTEIILKEHEEKNTERINTPSKAGSFFVYNTLPEENNTYNIMALDIGCNVVSCASAAADEIKNNASLVRDIYKFALLSNASSVIIGYKQEKLGASPAEEEINTLEKLARAGNILGIPVSDYIQYSSERYISYASERVLSFEENGHLTFRKALILGEKCLDGIMLDDSGSLFHREGKGLSASGDIFTKKNGMKGSLITLNEVTDYEMKEPLKGTKEIGSFLCRTLGKKASERFYVLSLDDKNKVISFCEIGSGGRNMSYFDICGIYQHAILCGASSVLVAHNHPSGNLLASKEDACATKRIMEASSVMGIPLADHIIVGRGKYSSFEQSNILNMESIDEFIASGGGKLKENTAAGIKEKEEEYIF